MPSPLPSKPLTPNTTHPEPLHEIGLTLSEVTEVLRRRASRSLNLDLDDDDGN
ncbi:MAG: hypothetical protein Q9222_000204, partial [Ikaeria aurantiellina]